MSLINKPFIKQRLDEEKVNDKRRIISVSLNLEELKLLSEDAKFLKQEKHSSAYKTLAEIGHIVIHDVQIGHIIRVIFDNSRKNKRLGIGEVDPNYTQM